MKKVRKYLNNNTKSVTREHIGMWKYLTFTFLFLSSLSYSCYEATIQKPTPFMGNNGEIFVLSNGSIWEVKYEYEYLYEYSPNVVICPDKNILIINGKKLNVLRIYSK